MSVHTHIFKSRKNGYVALSLLQLLQKFRYTIIFSISLYFTPLAGRSLSTEHARRHHQPGRVKQADPCRWLPGQRAHQSARRFAERQRPQTATGLGGNADGGGGHNNSEQHDDHDGGWQRGERNHLHQQHLCHAVAQRCPWLLQERTEKHSSGKFTFTIGIYCM